MVRGRDVSSAEADAFRRELRPVPAHDAPVCAHPHVLRSPTGRIALIFRSGSPFVTGVTRAPDTSRRGPRPGYPSRSCRPRPLRSRSPTSARAGTAPAAMALESLAVPSQRAIHDAREHQDRAVPSASHRGDRVFHGLERPHGLEPAVVVPDDPGSAEPHPQVAVGVRRESEDPGDGRRRPTRARETVGTSIRRNAAGPCPCRSRGSRRAVWLIAWTVPPGNPLSVPQRSRPYCDIARSGSMACAEPAARPAAATRAAGTTGVSREVFELLDDDLGPPLERLRAAPEHVEVHAHPLVARRRHSRGEFVLGDGLAGWLAESRPLSVRKVTRPGSQRRVWVRTPAGAANRADVPAARSTAAPRIARSSRSGRPIG